MSFACQPCTVSDMLNCDSDRSIAVDPRTTVRDPAAECLTVPRRRRELLPADTYQALTPIQRIALRWHPTPVTARLPEHRGHTRDQVTAALAGIMERPGRPVPEPVTVVVYETLVRCQAATGVLFLRHVKVATLATQSLAVYNANRVAAGMEPCDAKVTIAKVAAVYARLLTLGWIEHGRKTARHQVYTARSPTLPDATPDRTSVERLPDDRTVDIDPVLAGPGIDRQVARMVYAEIEYLTRPTGTLHLSFDRLTDRVNTGIRRRNQTRYTMLPYVTVNQVRLVLDRLVRAGWMTCVRAALKGARYLVAGGSRGGIKVLENTASPANAGPVVSNRENNIQSRDARERARDEQARKTAGVHAARIVDRYRARLECRNAPNPAGAWWRYLTCRLRWTTDPYRQSELAGAFDRAVASMIDTAGVANLSDRRFTRNLRLGVDF